MSETFPIEFVGGSLDGATGEDSVAPSHCELTVTRTLREIYERQTDEPPFIYVQIGYAETESWT
jgi:hypothetical protein